jgi:hypothetical protein
LVGVKFYPPFLESCIFTSARELIPLKAIMKVLHCSHRTAQAYLMTLRGFRMSEKLVGEAMMAVATQKAKKDSAMDKKE